MSDKRRTKEKQMNQIPWTNRSTFIFAIFPYEKYGNVYCLCMYIHNSIQITFERVVPVPRDLMPSPDTHEHKTHISCTYIHAGKQFYIYKINKYKKGNIH